ncbi:MAG TPA: DUF4810 domain-containing protein [Rhodocyclaceae bacterium]|uniref:DUF4810 domain-containing protein n=1 Tax=Betaproteobacteria TaxID=28216 RepID=UPI002C93B0ED|nr:MULTISPECIES: DUF4810 domain-containing protein [Betaproteobacteria]HMW87727.1 DUF4810 domain-containing protein [Nitrospira sp.]HMZ77986.1 DUF4810 domain-containing protein [Rhodocyclaceae bacterium]HMV07113.1 DUF4810 domain-containing protein [Accumulibacter sp.]HMW56882.1 DUF4810 domain-containing protein [Accumulibacter sp.]HNC53743.1 DUF4810 domain-containing protein [Accumulibacter sp.]
MSAKQLPMTARALSRSVGAAGLTLALVLLAGCANRPQSLYYWGTYQGQVYGQLQGTISPQAQIQSLEETREKARAEGKALPPGFQAHLGMLYGESGQLDRFQQNLDAEKRQFPESATFVDFMMDKLKR